MEKNNKLNISKREKDPKHNFLFTISKKKFKVENVGKFVNFQKIKKTHQQLQEQVPKKYPKKNAQITKKTKKYKNKSKDKRKMQKI